MRLAFERGRLALAVGDPAGAEPYFERALREARRSEGPGSLEEGWAQLGLGRSLRAQGKTPAARTALLRSLAIFRGETAVRPAHTRGLIAVYTELAALDRCEGRLDPARARVIDALRMGRVELGASHPRVAPVFAELARIELARGDLAAADAAARSADEIAAARLPIGHPSRVEAGEVRATVARARAGLTPP
ncbi:MAG: tetratricopeptide repeat protein [Myxococcota bacterium]